MSEQKTIRLLEVDDLVTSIKTAAERCKCMLDYMLNDFQKEPFDEAAKLQLLSNHKNHSILLETAFLAAAEVLDYTDQWEQIYQRVQDQAES